MKLLYRGSLWIFVVGAVAAAVLFGILVPTDERALVVYGGMASSTDGAMLRATEAMIAQEFHTRLAWAAAYLALTGAVVAMATRKSAKAD